MGQKFCAAGEGCWLVKKIAATNTSRITLGQGAMSGFEAWENEQTQRVTKPEKDTENPVHVILDEILDCEVTLQVFDE